MHELGTKHFNQNRKWEEREKKGTQIGTNQDKKRTSDCEPHKGTDQGSKPDQRLTRQMQGAEQRHNRNTQY